MGKMFKMPHIEHHALNQTSTWKMPAHYQHHSMIKNFFKMPEHHTKTAEHTTEHADKKVQPKSHYKDPLAELFKSMFKPPTHHTTHNKHAQGNKQNENFSMWG